MGTHQDPVQRAVVLAVAVISTGLDGAFDTLVGMAIHKNASFCFGFGNSMAQEKEFMRRKRGHDCIFQGCMVFYGYKIDKLLLCAPSWRSRRERQGALL